MAATDADQERVSRFLMQDLAATTGSRHEAIVEDDAAHGRGFDREAGEYVQHVVDDVQQHLHDLRIDTTWPRCPRHRRHPLWFRDGWWWCERDSVAIARLGDLGADDSEKTDLSRE
jgi:hypothetical protein